MPEPATTACTGQWQSIVQHVAREIVYGGKPFQRLYDVLVCGHEVPCCRWYRADNAEAEIYKGHHRRKCRG